MHKKTEKQRYHSKYGETYCTAQQYLCEVLLERKYLKRGVNLPPHFWNLDKYQKEFQKEIFRVNYLIKKFGEESVVNTVKNNTWVYSLFYPKIEELIKKQEKILKNQLMQIKSNQEIKPRTEDKMVGKEKNIGRWRKLDG